MRFYPAAAHKPTVSAHRPHRTVLWLLLPEHADADAWNLHDNRLGLRHLYRSGPLLHSAAE